MNAGAFGMAFIADGDKIIKLTSNRDEAAEVKGLIDKKVPGCIEYYDIVYSKKFDIWAILMQRTESLTKKSATSGGGAYRQRGETGLIQSFH